MSLTKKIDRFFKRPETVNTIFVSMFFIFSLSGCVNELKITTAPKKIASSSSSINVNISNIEVVNNQIVITGTNLDQVDHFNVKEGAIVKNMVIESKSSSTIIANTLSNVTFAAGKMLDFVLSNAEGASTFSVNFSLCDSDLGGKGFNCAATPTAGQFLAYDGGTGKWIPKSISGLLSYKGSWNPAGSFPTPAVSGDYYIASSDSGIYYSGDWIVYNGSTWDHISNSNTVPSVFGRPGAIVAEEGDYTLDLLGDVEISGTPTVGQVLRYDASGKWIPGTVSTTDPSVRAFAKTNLPTCSASEVLSSDGTSLGCVTDVTGGGGTTYSGGANFVLVTDGAGAISDSTITTSKLNYLSAVTSDIQAQINGKASSASIVDWSAANAALTIHPTRLNLTTAGRVVVTDGGGQLAVSAVTSTQVGYLGSVTSDIQTQLNSKLSAETDPGVEAFAKTSLPTCSAGEVLFTDGTTLTCVTDSSGAGALTAASTVPGNSFRIYNGAGTFYTELTSVSGSNRTLIFPNSSGASGDVLTTNGSGTLSWTTPSGGGAVASVNSQTGAVSLDADDIPAGSTNTYYTDAKVRATPLTGLSTASAADVSASDTVLVAIGKLQAKAVAVMQAALGTVSTATSSTILTGDTLIAALGKLQAQINTLGSVDSNKINKNTADSLTATLTVSGAGDIILPAPAGLTSAVNQGFVNTAISTATSAITSSQWTTVATDNLYFTTAATGRVGVGTNSPASKLDVQNGSITTAFATTATLANNFATANVIATTAAAGTLDLQNMQNGTSYTLIIQNTGSYTLGGSSVTTWRCAPACTGGVLSNTSGHMIVTILKANTTAYVSYIGDM